MERSISNSVWYWGDCFPHDYGSAGDYWSNSVAMLDEHLCSYLNNNGDLVPVDCDDPGTTKNSLCVTKSDPGKSTQDVELNNCTKLKN